MLNRNAYPRPEYPRPDRQRGTIEGVNWLNLNGPWQFRFETEQRGLHEQWHLPDQDEWTEQIIVPFCWESLAAWGEADSAGNDNYYSTRVFLNPLEVTAANHRSAPRYEVGWYRREISIPSESNPAWKDRRVIFTIGAADFRTDCWCNGVHLGQHEDGYTPFEFDLTDALETTPDGTRRAVLVIRVEDPMDNREQPVGKQWSWYTTTSGIWQTVWIEPRHASHIDCFRITSDIDAGTASFVIDCQNSEGCEVEIEITPPTSSTDSGVFRETIPVNGGVASQTVTIAPVCLWDPNHPDLYRVKLCLRAPHPVPDTLDAITAERQSSDDGDANTRVEVDVLDDCDVVHTYFGMRKIDAGPPVLQGNEDESAANAPMILRLNGKPRYLRGALYQSYHCDGVYTATDVQVLRDDIAFAQKAGFNFLRVHIKIDDPLLLYYADTMGMLLMCDFPNFGEGGDTPLARNRFETMMREGFKRDYNHPSIIAWCLFNETWGFGGQVELIKHFSNIPTRLRRKPAPEGEESVAVINTVTSPSVDEETQAEAQAAVQEAVQVTTPAPKMANLDAHTWVQSIWELAKSIDSTRLIEDMSVVYWEHLDYFGHTVTDINSWHFYINDYAHAKEHIEKIVRDTYAGSSFNYVQGFAQGSQPLINSEYGGVGALDGDCDISWSFKFLTNEMRLHGSICAYIFTQLHDVEWEYNGLLNYDRTAKQFGYDPAIINAADVLPMDAPPVARRQFGEKVVVPVYSSHYSTQHHENVSLQWRLSGMDTAGQMHADLARGTASIPFPHRRVAPAHVIELTLPSDQFLCTLSIAAITNKGTVISRNYVQFFVSEGYPPSREEIPHGLLLRARPEDWANAHWDTNTFSANREEAKNQDLVWGDGSGFFEWSLPLDGADLRTARRLRVICEASSHLIPTLPGATPQTDSEVHPTSLEMLLNDVHVYDSRLSNHPYDTRGVLSYLRGAKGAYGYLAHATAEGDLLRQIAERGDTHLRLRCAVPGDAIPQGGLTIYGAECGRYPICPTVIIEW